MADDYIQVATDGSGKKVDNDSLTVGANTVYRQRVVNADPTTAAALAKVTNAANASTDYGLTVRQAGDGLVVLNAQTWSSAAVIGSAQDTSGGYAAFNIQASGTFNSTIIVEESNDNTNWTQIPFYQLNSSLPSSTSSAITLAGQYWGYIKARYIRVRASAYTSNTSGLVTLVLRSTPPPVELANIGSIGSAVTVNGNQGSGANAVSVIACATANATSTAFTNARVASAATTNATSVKGSAGNLYGGFLSNTSASAKFFKWYNKATAPTVGTDTPIWTLLLPAGTTVPLNMDMNPLRFGTGIAYAITGAVADSDTTAVAANDVHGVLNYA